MSVHSGLLGLGEIRHVGCVVSDLRAAIADQQTIDPTVEWIGWTYGPGFLKWQTIEGLPARFAADIAVTTGPGPQLEFIQPLDDHSSFSHRLADGQRSVHHLGFVVDDFQKEVSRMERMGFSVREACGGHGLDGDGSLAYLDTRSAIGVFVEIIQSPIRRAQPHFVLPPRETLGQ